MVDEEARACWQLLLLLTLLSQARAWLAEVLRWWWGWWAGLLCSCRIAVFAVFFVAGQ
jgi:hypothetical protein